MRAEPNRAIAEASATPSAWWPLLFAVLPLAVTHVAYVLSIRDGFAPDCLPYWDGCTSISRAARHGTGNLLFKAVMLPCAVVLAMLWWQARRWLRAGGDDARAMLVAGIVGAFALALYVAFLGAEGDFSRWLRRFGALIYFAATYLAQLLLVQRCWRRGLRSPPMRWMLAACVLLLLGGLASTAASATIEDAALKDRIENAIEWGLGALFTLWFLALAGLWLQVSCPANTIE